LKINSKLLPFLLLFWSPVFLGFDLKGEVRLEGPPPKPAWLEVETKHQAECGEKLLSPKLRVSPEGGVENAVVWVEGNFPEPAPAGKNYALDQKNCEFTPHVLLMPAGQTLSIINSDGFLHNVRAFDETTQMLFNDAMPKKGQVLKKRFDRPGRVLVRCGLHHWMHALVVVQDHPYYVLTSPSGQFRISGIPEGNYTLHVWHETLGELKKEVRSDISPLELNYPAPNQ